MCDICNGTISEHDHCPKCKKDAIHYETVEMINAEDGFYRGECKECGYTGKQWIKVTFVEWEEYSVKAE